jgi:tetratricopeptide (TPR) repeat protein
MASTSGLRGIVEHLAGNHAEAARLIRENYDGLIAIGDQSYASTVAVELGNVLLDLPDDDEAWRFGTIARETSSSDDVISQAGGRAIQARVLSRRGDRDAAEALAREAADIMGQTDYVDQHGEILVHLARVLHEAGKRDEAVAAAREAVALYEQKGATLFVGRTQRLIDEWAG